MSAGRTALRVALSLLPDLVEWVVDRLEVGESEESVRRDIQDHRSRVAANRAARDAEFEEKFGPLDEKD